MSSAGARSAGGPSSRKLRILALHGFLQNASMFRQKTAALRKHLKSVAEFEYVDGPIRMWNTSWHEIVAEGKGTFHGNGKLSPKAVALIQQQKEEEGAGDEETEEKEEPLYSWFHFQGRHSPVGEFKETTEKYLDEYIRRNGPFDGIFAFSQGAATAAAYAISLAQDQERAREINNNSIQFLILFSAFPKMGLTPEEHEDGFNIHSLHIVGAKDENIPKERSVELAKMFTPTEMDCNVTEEIPELSSTDSETGIHKVMHMHHGGHFVPCDKPRRDVLKRFIQSVGECLS